MKSIKSSQNLYFSIILSFKLFIFSTAASAEIIPTLLTDKQRKNIAPYFSVAYPQLLSTRPYFIGSYPGLEVGTSINYLGLSELQEDYPSDSIRDSIVLTQIFIKKSLVHRLELTFSSTLSSFGTSQISGFGGMLAWHPLDINHYKFLPSVSVFTNYMNYEDTLTYQESGLLMSCGQNFKKFSLNSGLSLSQMSSRFSGSSSGRQITASNSTEKESLFLQTFFVSLIINYENYLLTLVQNYNPESGFQPGIVLSYQL